MKGGDLCKLRDFRFSGVDNCGINEKMRLFYAVLCCSFVWTTILWKKRVDQCKIPCSSFPGNSFRCSSFPGYSFRCSSFPGNSFCKIVWKTISFHVRLSEQSHSMFALVILRKFTFVLVVPCEISNLWCFDHHFCEKRGWYIDFRGSRFPGDDLYSIDNSFHVRIGRSKLYFAFQTHFTFALVTPS